MGLSPSNPGVQKREIVLSVTSFNSTTGGSGGTIGETHSRDTKQTAKLTVQFNIPVFSAVKETVMIMTSCTDKSWSCE